MTDCLRRLVVAMTGLAVLGIGPALAQDYPNKPIEVIVGFSAGGGVDITARTLVPYLEKELGQPVVVVNKPGAGGALAWTDVVQAKPDGYTLGSINYPAISGVTATGGLPFDPTESFTFLGNVVYEPNVIAVPANSPHKTLGDVIAFLKANPSGLTYGATGSTSLDGLTALAIETAAGVKFRVVNFAGGPEMITAALGGHIDTLGLGVAEVLPYYKDGSLRVLGVGGQARSAYFPDVATFAEQGYAIPINGSSRGLLMPAGADEAVVSKLRQAIEKVSANPEYQQKSKGFGQDVLFDAGPNVQSSVKAQIEFLKNSLPK